MKKTLISSVIALGATLIPLSAHADESDEGGADLVKVTPGGTDISPNRPVDSEDTPRADAATLVSPAATPVEDFPRTMAELSADYDALRREISEGPLNIYNEAMRPEWDRLSGLKTTAEDKCSEYVTAMQGLNELHLERQQQIDNIANAPDGTAREKARQIFDSTNESLETEQVRINELYSACGVATEEFQTQMDTVSTQLKANLLETDVQKEARARNAAGSLIAPVQVDVDRLEGRVDDVERRVLSLQPLMGMEGHGDGNQFLAGAGLCYGQSWQLCAQAMAYFGGDSSESSTSSSTPGQKTFEGGYAENFTRGVQSDVVRSYQGSVGAEVRTPNLLSSLDWTLQLGLAGRLFQGEEEKTKETTRRSQYVNNGNNVGEPVTISNTEQEGTRFRNVGGEASASVCYGQICLQGAIGMDSDEETIARGALGYRF